MVFSGRLASPEVLPRRRTPPLGTSFRAGHYGVEQPRKLAPRPAIHLFHCEKRAPQTEYPGKVANIAGKMPSELNLHLRNRRLRVESSAERGST